MGQTGVILALVYATLYFSCFSEIEFVLEKSADINRFMIKNCFVTCSIDWHGFWENSNSPSLYIRKAI